MVKLSKTGSGFALALSDKELKDLELDLEKDYEIVKARKGLYVLMDKKLFEQELVRKVDEKIIALLQNSKIQDRVEEKFEKFLNKIELLRFNELLKDGVVEKFKASEKYKKAVYKLKEPVQDRKASSGIQRFITVRSEQQARELNDKHWRELKEGKMKGLKDFDNTYYLIDTELLGEKKQKILKILQACKSASIEELSSKLAIQPELVRGVCAFIKEDGEILEKKKGIYNYIP